MEKKNSLNIKGNVTYSAQISDALAARIITLCAAGDNTAVALEPQSVDIGDGIGSISEYMDKLKPKRHPDKILAIAAYMTNKKSQKYFTSQEIKPYFSKAGEPMPANFTRDFDWVISTRWIAEADDKRGAYYVTNKGMRVIEEGFPKDLIKETRGKTIGRKSTKKK